MTLRTCWWLGILVAAVAFAMSGCGEEIPLQPVNHSPIVQSLTAFPTTIGLGDSAVVICAATDVDGDTLMFDWTSDCRLVKKGQQPDAYWLTTWEGTLVVHAGACATSPLDTGWVSCSVRDRRGGGARAGTVRIIIQQ